METYNNFSQYSNFVAKLCVRKKEVSAISANIAVPNFWYRSQCGLKILLLKIKNMQIANGMKKTGDS